MAHILSRKYGSDTRYTANIRVRKGKKVVYREAKTFAHRAAAATWAKKREVELENPATLVRAQHGAPTLAELIRWYIDSFESVSKWQRSKQTHLEFLERHPIGQSNPYTLTGAALIDHVRSRRASGTGASTVGNDLTWIGVVLSTAKSVQELPVKPEVVDEARTACRALRLIAKSRRRERRPTDAEMEMLDEHFQRRDQRSEIPMFDIWHFAIESAKREAEICRLEWADLNEKNRTGLVRDAKHPRAKDGNHRRFKFTPEAWDIVQRQPRTSEYIFPYNPKSVGAAFTRACKVLGIVDLRFHDSRHEGTSQLFERGYQIHEVAQITLHESWNELKRYTNLRPENLRELPRKPASTTAAHVHRASRKKPTVNSPADAVGRLARPGRPRSPAVHLT